MSFRDLRKFTEMMRALGYHRVISVENFKTPNFPLVAEILLWLVKKYDPQMDIPTDVDTESGRVFFIKAVAEFMATKAQIRVNMKHLYQADGHAVKEMLKITSALYIAMTTNKVTPGETSEEVNSKVKFGLGSRVSDITTVGHLPSEITSKGASMYSLLGKEVDLREKRNAAIARPLDVNQAEKALRAAIKEVLENTEKMEQMLSDVVSDKISLDKRIERKEQELKRIQKRLEMLQSARPVFMDEFEKIEAELQTCYETYVEKLRNLSFLESQLEEYDRVEQEKSEEAEKRQKMMQRSLRKEEERNLWRSSSKDDESDLDIFEDEGSDSDTEEIQPLRNDVITGGGGRFIGNMQGEIDEDDDDEADDEDEEADSEDLEDESLSGPVSWDARPSKDDMRQPPEEDSNNDF